MALNYEEFRKEIKRFSKLLNDQREYYGQEELDSRDPKVGFMYSCDTISNSLTTLAIRLNQANE